MKNMIALIEEISTCSYQQKEGIAQIQKTIMQIEQVSCQNAELVEELSAAGANVKSNANQLNELVDQFKLS